MSDTSKEDKRTTAESSVDLQRLVIKPIDAVMALEIVIAYLNQIADWKEKEGFEKAPKFERKSAELLQRLKIGIAKGI